MPKVVLVGGGHAHLHVLSKFYKNPIPNVDIMLISPERYAYYSGMLAGYVEGVYSLDEIRTDLEQMCASQGVTLIQSTVTSINPTEKYMLTAGNQRIDYDYLSINIGSLTASNEHRVGQPNQWTVKPLSRIPSLVENIQPNQQLIIVGGGASAVEISLALQSRMEKANQHIKIMIINKQRILNQWGTTRSQKLRKILNKQGIELVENEQVTFVDSSKASTDQGRDIPFDHLLWATGPQSPRLFKNSQLPVDHEGYLYVNSYLQVTSYPEIFAAGDCAHVSNYPNLPKAGVFAVRQSNILYRNLRNAIRGKELITYHPKKNYLSLVSIGQQKALFFYGKSTFQGSWVWWLKYCIDKQYMKKYKRDK